jgi:glycosyltransferase involved in cell wall biosynthesis
MKLSASESGPPRLLTYCFLPYNGRGPSRSCVRIISEIPTEAFTTELFLPRARKAIPKSVHVREALTPALRRAPWRWVHRAGVEALNRAMFKAIESCDPERTIAYFFPGPPLDLLRYAKSRGVLTVREMINCYNGTSKRILSQAYADLALPPFDQIPDSKIEAERQELPLYDHVFASKQVEATLVEAGVNPARILPSAFGWDPADLLPQREALPATRGVTALYVGLLCVRKGVLDLLEAWRRAGIDGTLLMLGDIHPELAPLIKKYQDDPTIKFVGFKPNIGDYYRAADFFVFPSLEEGGPQVTCEASGCGLPVITTPMGAGRITEDEVNGLIVPPRNIEALQAAITRLAESPELRARLGARGKADAARFTYRALAAHRADLLSEALSRHNAGRARLEDHAVERRPSIRA